jgi:hypothetical protein
MRNNMWKHACGKAVHIESVLKAQRNAKITGFSETGTAE